VVGVAPLRDLFFARDRKTFKLVRE